MIIGIGTDIVDIRRLGFDYSELNKLAKRILTNKEYEGYEQSYTKPSFLAKRLAAKEAFIKATGSSAPMSEIEINHDPAGKPYIRCTFYSTPNTHLSISDDGHYVVAFVVAEA